MGNNKLGNSQIVSQETALHAEHMRIARHMAKSGYSTTDDINHGLHSLMLSKKSSPSDVLVRNMEKAVAPHNIMAKNFRENTRANPNTLMTPSDVRKAHPQLAKAALDVGSMANLSQVTGGQSLGYVSLDVQMARGTIRPNSFTLYNSLNKTAAYQVVDFWSYASSTGGGAPGTAYMSTGSVANGSLNTSAGEYELKQITLKLAVDGRAITTALAAQNSYVNVVEQENTNAALTVMESVNWSNYWGKSSVYPNMPDGIYASILQYAPENIYDYTAYANQTSGLGLPAAQTLFNQIMEVSAEITRYRAYGVITHAFMSPVVMGAMQTLVTGTLNNVVNNITSRMERDGIVVHGDLQGMKTRFGNIQFPIDLFISARNAPTAAFVISETGTSYATVTNPTPPASVVVAASAAAVAGSAFTASYVGDYTYAVASTNESSGESILTYGAASGLVLDGTYTLTITPPAANDEYAFRVFRSGLGYTTTPADPAQFRYIGELVANGATAVTFVDYNTHIPGSETVFLLDMSDEDNAIDFRYLLPLTKIELFAQSLYMPWAVALIGAIRVRVPKFHAIIENIVMDGFGFNPLLANNPNI